MTRNWEDIVDKDFPRIDIVTEKMQRAAFKQVRLMRGAIRLQMGRIPTTQEIEDRKRRAMRRDLF